MPETFVSLGSYDVHVLVDGLYPTAVADIIHAESAELRDNAMIAWGKPDFTVDVNCFALDGPDGLMLIDAGTGTHWGDAYGKAPTALSAAGFAPEQVRAVFLTHIHGDHALGLIEDGKALYPNAVVHVPQADLEWYGEPDNWISTPDNVRGGFRVVELLKRAYAGQIAAHKPGLVAPNIEAIALPGHTPGHSGFFIRGDGDSLFLWGDVIHVDALQFADPRFGVVYDLDPAMALTSRLMALEMAVREGCLVGGGHITGLNRLARSNGGFAFVQENHA